MYIQHNATIKNMDGVIEIDIYIVDEKSCRQYTYYLQSQFAVDKFERIYRRGKSLHGKALAILNKFKIKQEKEGGEKWH